MPDVCTLTGVLTAPDGSPWGGARVLVKPTPQQVRTTSGGLIVAPVPPQPVMTDADGQLTLLLAPGTYTGTATLPNNKAFSFDLAVPDLPDAPLDQYIGRIDVEVLTSAHHARDGAVAAQAQAVLAKSAAETARTNAIAAAAVIQPFADRPTAEAAEPPPVASSLSLLQNGVRLDYVEDPAAAQPALLTADARRWQPAGVIAAVEHFGPALSWVELGQALQWSINNGRRITASGSYTIAGQISLQLNGPVAWDFTGARFAAADGFPLGQRMINIGPGTGAGHPLRWIGGVYDLMRMPRSEIGGANEAINIGLNNSHDAILLDHEEWYAGEAFCHNYRDSGGRLIGGDAAVMLVAPRATVRIGRAIGARDVPLYISAPASEGAARYGGIHVEGNFYRCKNAVNAKRGYRGFSADVYVEDCQGGVGFGGAEVGAAIVGGSCGMIRVRARRCEWAVSNRLGDNAIIDVVSEDIGVSIAESSPGAGDGYTSVEGSGLRLVASSYNRGRVIARGVNPICEAHPDYAANMGNFRALELEDGAGVSCLWNTVDVDSFGMGRAVHEQDGSDNNTIYLRDSGTTVGNIIVGPSTRVFRLGSQRTAGGDVAAPGMAFFSDPDTGIYRPAANELAITTGGNRRAKFGGAGAEIDQPLTVAGDLLINSGNIRATKVNNGGTTPASVELRDGDGTVAIGQIIGRLAYISNVASVEQRAAYIEARARNTTGRTSLCLSAGQADALADVLELSDDRVRMHTAGVQRLDVGTVRIDASLPIRPQGYTVATLPSASAAGAGAGAYVTDASGPTYRAVVVGGGSTLVNVTSDGINWRCS